MAGWAVSDRAGRSGDMLGSCGRTFFHARAHFCALSPSCARCGALLRSLPGLCALLERVPGWCVARCRPATLERVENGAESTCKGCPHRSAGVAIAETRTLMGRRQGVPGRQPAVLSTRHVWHRRHSLKLLSLSAARCAAGSGPGAVGESTRNGRSTAPGRARISTLGAFVPETGLAAAPVADRACGPLGSTPRLRFSLPRR